MSRKPKKIKRQKIELGDGGLDLLNALLEGSIEDVEREAAKVRPSRRRKHHPWVEPTSPRPPADCVFHAAKVVLFVQETECTHCKETYEAPISLPFIIHMDRTGRFRKTEGTPFPPRDLPVEIAHTKLRVPMCPQCIDHGYDLKWGEQLALDFNMEPEEVKVDLEEAFELGTDDLEDDVIRELGEFAPIPNTLQGDSGQ